MRGSRAALVLVVVLVLALPGCTSKFKAYEGPEVTRVLLFKEQRRIYLMHNDTVLRAFPVDLGFAPAGDKRMSGDGRTPEGSYVIDRRNPNSDYHLSIGVSYPDAEDVEVARAANVDPGGDIFIHGEGKKRNRPADWTAGCIAVTNPEIEEIYAMVRDGTRIDILP